MQRPDNIPRFAAQRVVDAENRRQCAVYAEIQVGIGVGQRIKLCLFPRRNAAALVLKDEVRTADEDFLPSTRLEIPCATTYCT